MIEIRGKNFVVYNASESVLESIIKDVFTGATMPISAMRRLRGSKAI